MGLAVIRLVQNLIKHIKALFGKGGADVKTELEKVQEEITE
jgi:hypothetical protein